MEKKFGNILITGGTGTFGKHFIDYMAQNFINNFDKIVVFSRDEYKQFNMEKDIRNKYGNDFFDWRIRMWIGDVRDYNRLLVALDKIDFVIHAAALKHVPICEYNPNEAIKTNVEGTKNVIMASIESNVNKVVGLSTDKAVEPVNLYGATKMVAEKLLVYSNNYSHDTRVTAVRYGNIIGSRGSVIEKFVEQDKLDVNHSFSVTDEKMTRFWLPIDKSIELVLHAVCNGYGGEVFLPSRIYSSKVTDIAYLINKKRPIEFTGIRPGEKIHEILLNQTEYDRIYVSDSDFGKFYAVLPEKNPPDWDINLYGKYDRKPFFSNEYCSKYVSDMQRIKNLVERYGIDNV